MVAEEFNWNKMEDEGLEKLSKWIEKDMEAVSACDFLKRQKN